MQVGQRVMLIATWPEDECVPPPLGAIGEIAEPMDLEGDYYVLFPDYPCPVDHEPEWFVPAWALIPIDEPPSALLTAEPRELEHSV
jgi:hypothetical protein